MNITNDTSPVFITWYLFIITSTPIKFVKFITHAWIRYHLCFLLSFFHIECNICIVPPYRWPLAVLFPPILPFALHHSSFNAFMIFYCYVWLWCVSFYERTHGCVKFASEIYPSASAIFFIDITFVTRIVIPMLLWCIKPCMYINYQSFDLEVWFFFRCCIFNS